MSERLCFYCLWPDIGYVDSDYIIEKFDKALEDGKIPSYIQADNILEKAKAVDLARVAILIYGKNTNVS